MLTSMVSRVPEIVETFNDAGISGAKGPKNRPGLDQMLKDAQRGRFDVVGMGDPFIGRSLVDSANTIEGLKACGVDLYLISKRSMRPRQAGS